MTTDELEQQLRGRDDVVFGDGVGEQMVADAERHLGVRFPPSFRGYLMRFGYLELGHFELFGLGDDVPTFLRLVEVTTSERTEPGCPLPKDLVPVMNDGGGNLYCVATADSSSGSIVCWDHAAGASQEPDEYAPSLEEWIVELLEDLDAD